jgi:threonine aldolase
MIDLRSDTVTRPTGEMRHAMAAAEVGDDVFGEDPTVNDLQERAARLLGFEAGLWVPSGTMGNAIAIRLLTEPGQEVLADARSHVVRYELAGMAVLSGVMPRAVQTGRGHLGVADVQASLSPKAYYKSDLGLVVLENTHNLAGGSVQDATSMRAVVAACREHDLRLHVDGARIWNAAVALGEEPAALAAGADTLMVCFSKGLCAPAGSMLLSSSVRIERARTIRKQLGGGMRQVGCLAAACLVALQTMRARLADDHQNARMLGDALARCPGVEVAPVDTNIVVATLADRTAPDVVAELAEVGVLTVAMDRFTLRLVTHHDVAAADCERAARALAQVLG